MSCSGCISTIKSSLSGLEGINEILVDVAGGKAEVYFDENKLRDVQQIAAVITASGYPAKIDKKVPAEQVKKELDLMTSRSRLYVASVGDIDISRDVFDTELAYAKKRYAKMYGVEMFSTDRGRSFLNTLKAQILSGLIREGIQLQEIRKAGFGVDQAIVDQEFSEILTKKGQALEEFKAWLEEKGYSFDRFMEKFETTVLVRHYLDKEIFSGVPNQLEQQQRYSSWFNNAKLLAKIVYLDKDLELLVKNQTGNSGCSAKSSGSGKSSCCSTKPTTK
jgi:copper chaperone CopZ